MVHLSKRARQSGMPQIASLARGLAAKTGPQSGHFRGGPTPDPLSLLAEQVLEY